MNYKRQTTLNGVNSELNNIIINGYNLYHLLTDIACSLVIHIFGFLKLVHCYLYMITSLKKMNITFAIAFIK